MAMSHNHGENLRSLEKQRKRAKALQTETIQEHKNKMIILKTEKEELRKGAVGDEFPFFTNNDKR